MTTACVYKKKPVFSSLHIDSVELGKTASSRTKTADPLVSAVFYEMIDSTDTKPYNDDIKK